MKRFIRIAIAVTSTLAVVGGLALVSARSNEARHQLTCTGLEISVLDSAKLGFVTKADVRKYIAEGYGTWSGQRLDSVNLRRLESVIGNKSAVRRAEAYTTLDGVLHIEVLQREPVVRFKTPYGGFYADETGFVFPLQPNYTPDILVIEGNIPIMREDGYKGAPRTEKEQKWLADVIRFVKVMERDKFWAETVKTVRSGRNGGLELIPHKGKERFIFGWPDGIEDKFSRMEEYYKYIKPSKEEGHYRTVDVRYNGQIVCRQK